MPGESNERQFVVAIPVTADGQVGHSWGKAPTIAVASVQGGTLTHWDVHAVAWDISHDEGPEGAHHARVARFVRDHEVTTVIAGHMGMPMQAMLTKLGCSVTLDATGEARAAVLAIVS